MTIERDWVEVGDRVFTRRYRFRDEQIGVVAGDGEALVVDTRTTPGQARELIADVGRLTPVPVRVVVNTHWHYDHTFGNHDFRPAVIWGHARCRARLLAEAGTVIDEVAAELPGLAAELREVEIDPPERTFDEAATIEVGGRSVELRYLGRGHTDNDIVVEVPDAGVIFAGDLLETMPSPTSAMAIRSTGRPRSSGSWSASGGLSSRATARSATAPSSCVSSPSSRLSPPSPGGSTPASSIATRRWRRCRSTGPARSSLSTAPWPSSAASSAELRPPQQ
ncbi:MAG: MBL fold metallo-hydrolase [Chloroflexi bacterium]|nr:MBL fold metallo-hydrolase [Chloroflexota bacterium]